MTSKLLQVTSTAFIVSLIVFFIMRILPGDVAVQILGSGDQIDPEALAQLQDDLGLNDPFLVQYVDWIGGVLTLDLGTSLYSGRPIGPELFDRLAASYELALLSLLIGLMLALPMGIIGAIWRDSFADHALRFVAALGLSVPTFWLGTLFLIFSVRWFGTIPQLRYNEPWVDLPANLTHLIWPASIVGIHLAATLSRMVRSSFLEVLQQDYIRTARSKGLRSSVVYFRHGLRNAAIPVVSLSGTVFTNMLGSLVVMEIVFAVPGIGLGLTQAVRYRDYPVVQSILLIFALNTVIVNLLLDLAYSRLNPRIDA